MADAYDPLFGERERGTAPRRRSAETWAAVREGYLAGVPAPQLCARFDVGMTALRTRAREEGWRRTDTPDPEPDFPECEGDDASPAELRVLAWRRMAAAVRRGRVTEANGWMRMVRALDLAAARAEASTAAPPQPGRAGEALVRAREAVAALRSAASPEPPDAPEFEAPSAAEPPAPPPERVIPASVPADPSLGEVSSAVEAAPSAPPPVTEAPEAHDPHVPHAISAPRGPALPDRPPAWVRSALGMR